MPRRVTAEPTENTMSRRRSDRLFILAALACGLPAFAALAQDAAPVAPAQSLPAIVVTPVFERQLADRVVATGSVRAVEEVYVQPLVEGLQVKTLSADTGDRVKAGDVLATLADDSLVLQKSQLAATRAKGEASLAQLKAQLIDAQASATEARRQRERTATLGKNGTVSTAQVEQAETSAASADAKVKAAEQAIAVAEAEIKVVDAQISDVDLSLARTAIKAPASGLVSARNAKVGAIAAASGEPLFTLIRDGQVELVADVTESDILKIRPGLKAEIRVAGSAEALAGSIRLVSPTVDATTRLGSVHIAIDEDDKARAGMYGSAAILVSEAKGLAVPLSAVTTGKEGATVRLVKDGIVHQVTIETGIQDGGFVEVRKGLEAGAEIVAKAGAFVRDGDRVAPLRQTAAAATATD